MYLLPEQLDAWRKADSQVLEESLRGRRWPLSTPYPSTCFGGSPAPHPFTHRLCSTSTTACADLPSPGAPRQPLPCPCPRRVVGSDGRRSAVWASLHGGKGSRRLLLLRLGVTVRLQGVSGHLRWTSQAAPPSRSTCPRCVPSWGRTSSLIWVAMPVRPGPTWQVCLLVTDTPVSALRLRLQSKEHMHGRDGAAVTVETHRPAGGMVQGRESSPAWLSATRRWGPYALARAQRAGDRGSSADPGQLWPGRRISQLLSHPPPQGRRTFSSGTFGGVVDGSVPSQERGSDTCRGFSSAEWSLFRPGALSWGLSFHSGKPTAN